MSWQKYGMYASRRKFELIEPESYSVINYDEADAVLAQWAQLAEQAQTLYGKLSSDDQPAFFQMILHPILAGQTVNGIYVGAAKNQLYAGQKRNAANAAIHNVLRLSNEDANLTIRWNQMLGGKWEHMMDRKSALSPSAIPEACESPVDACAETHLGYDGYWQQPMRNTLPAMTYVQTSFVSLAGHVGVGVEGRNATVQGDDKYHSNSGNSLAVPPMDQYGPARRYFEIFWRGTNSCSWTASPTQPWVKLSQYTGAVGLGAGPRLARLRLHRLGHRQNRNGQYQYHHALQVLGQIRLWGYPRYRSPSWCDPCLRASSTGSSSRTGTSLSKGRTIRASCRRASPTPRPPT